MNPLRHLILLFVFAGTVLATPPTDPKLAEKIDRTIKSRPVTMSKTPRYALMVFGKKALQQRWIVFDLYRHREQEKRGQNGRVLGHVFLDRNGDGDFSDPGEKISSLKGPKGTLFPRIEILDREGHLLGYEVELRPFLGAARVREPGRLGLYVTVRTEDGDCFSAEVDQNGRLSAGDSPATAPVVHIDGPLQMGFQSRFSLTKNHRPGQGGNYHFRACVGTYGIGPGSLAKLHFKSIPAQVHPEVEIEWPAVVAGAEPERTRFVLKDRC